MQKIGWTGFALVWAVLASAPQGALAANEGQAAKEPKPVRVSVEFIDVSSDVYAEAVKGIQAGDGYAARMLAALIKGGAHPTETPVLTTVEGVAGHVAMSNTFHYSTTDGKPQTLTAVNSLEATPHVNADGSITSNLKIHRDVFVASTTSPVPATNTSEMTTTPTQRDGDTCILAGWAPKVAPDSIMHLIFVKMSTVRKAR